MRRELKKPRGIVPGAPNGEMEHRRVPPSPALAHRLAHFWWVRWNLNEPFVAMTLPHPTVHVIFEPPAAGVVHGVPERRFERRLEGRGFVFGVKFRPGGFSGLVDSDVRALTNRGLPAREVFQGVARLERVVAKAASMETCVEAAEAFFSLPALSDEAGLVRDVVERLEEDRSFVRVEQAAALAGVDVRTLQRLFRRHVGVTPKWVLARYRLHEAAARLTEAPRSSLARLAAELGYADQAHFTRDFTSVVGRSPRVVAGVVRGR
ncbi:MAG: AraC family transcriptional regulator [Archangium sp.]|nr:AraC family transcriptional regulator [Archangium sp.]